MPCSEGLLEGVQNSLKGAGLSGEPQPPGLGLPGKMWRGQLLCFGGTQQCGAEGLGCRCHVQGHRHDACMHALCAQAGTCAARAS